MTTSTELIDFLDSNQQSPVLAGTQASVPNHRRILADRIKLIALPVQSMALYLVEAAGVGAAHEAANDELEQGGFVSYRRLLPMLKLRFPDLWPA